MGGFRALAAYPGWKQVCGRGPVPDWGHDVRFNIAQLKTHQAVEAACHALSGVFEVGADESPNHLMSRTAAELWRFCCTLRLMDPPDGAWVALLQRTRSRRERSRPVLIGPALAGRFAAKRHAEAMEQLRLVARGYADTLRRPGDSSNGSLALSNGGHFHSVLDDEHEGAALMIGGVIRESGEAVSDIHTDPVAAAMFAAFSRTACRRIVVPRARHEFLLAKLTPMPRAILPLIIEGLTTPEIAKKIERSPHTAHDHVMVIFRTLGVTSRRELLSLWNGEPVPHRPPTGSRRARAKGAAKPKLVPQVRRMNNQTPAHR